MIHNGSTTLEKHLSQIADMLLLNGTLTECPGLVHGKMGITIFFFHYAKYTNNMLFADYAMDVVGEMLNQIHMNSPADYEKGIAGIGVGIDHLIQNNLLDVDEDIFDDLDHRMYRAVIYDSWQNFSLYNGLIGYGRYWISRFRSQGSSIDARKCLLRIITLIEEELLNIPPFEQAEVFCFLHDLQEISEFNIPPELLNKSKQLADVKPIFNRLGNSNIGNITRMYHCCRYFNTSSEAEMDIALTQMSDYFQKPQTAMGLLTGYAGEGLLRLTILQQNNKSWALIL